MRSADLTAPLPSTRLLGIPLRALRAACSVVVLDLVSKRWAASELVDSPREIFPGFLSLKFVENPGAAFGVFQDAGPLLGVAAVAAVGFIAAALTRPRPSHEVLAFGLIMGGALGNLIDRIFRGPGFLDGKVIDWVQLGPIPTFNVADASITVAVALLILGSWRNDSRGRKTDTSGSRSPGG